MSHFHPYSNEKNAKGPAGSTDYYKILLLGSVFDPSIDP